MKLKPSHHQLKAQDRLYQINIPVIGLTGGIASGKTTVSKMLEKKGLAVINADHLVKDIYKMEETKKFIQANCPEVMRGEEIQFPFLREKFLEDESLKLEIEKFIYARLPQAFAIAMSRLNKPEVIIYDVPLLFEKNMEGLFDLTVLVYAPRKIQKARLMVRDNHLENMAETILNQQMDIEAKKAKTDFVIDNSQTEAELTLEVENFLRQVLN